MEELNLLEHSTYNVEQVKNNRIFFDKLLSEIESIYATYSMKRSGTNNRINVQFAPSQYPRRQNVFFDMDKDGHFEITFVGVSRIGEKNIDTLKAKYRNSTYSCNTLRIYIEGITAENYKEHLPYIVMCIEGCDYSFK